MWSACASAIMNNFWKAAGTASLVNVCVGDQPGMFEDLGTGFPRCAGRTLFCGWWSVGTYDSVGWADEMPGGGPTGGELPEDEGCQPMSPLTGVLPDSAMTLWTAVVAADPDVANG